MIRTAPVVFRAPLRALAALLVVTALASIAGAQSHPLIAKDTIRAKTHADDNANGNPWVPELEFQVLGPLPSGSILWVDYGYPGKKSWVKKDCDTDSNILNQWLLATCNVDKKNAGSYAGPLDFSIHLRNELESTDSVLYTGKIKVVKTINPKNKETEYYVDEDWRLPIGYLYHDAARGLHIVMWFRGSPGGVKNFLFYQGKEIAKGENCGAGDDSDFNPSAEGWWELDCEFVGVYEDAQKAAAGDAPNFAISHNPGNYEIKSLAGGKLARVIKFSVTPAGKLDDSISAANKIPRDRVIVPVQLVGNQGNWDRLAWKTGAYYNNPLTGFEAPAAPVAGAK